MIVVVNNCMVVQLQIDKLHLLFQMQMQNLEHNDFGEPAIDSRKHVFLVDVA